ncbi:MAG: methyl-accepting chemotaxis protein, partial [Pseudomonas sp.]|uniref:HAMP domain-containing protein n=1 Tax=Pseudomonas sp. TaxID=306 RepID=UPI003BB6D6EF
MTGNVMSLRIGSKLMLAFGVLILGFGSLLYISLERFVALQQAEALLFQQSYARASDIKELRVNIAAARASVLLAMNAGPGAELEQHEAEIRRRAGLNDELVKRLREAMSGDTEAKTILDLLEEVRSAFTRVRDSQLLPLIRADQNQEARSLYRGAQSERSNKIDELGLQLSELAEQRVTQGLERSHLALQAQRDLLFKLGLALVLGSALLAWLLSRHIAQPLARLTGWAEQIGRGEIPREISGSTRQDEVGRLAQAFVKMSQYLRELVQELNESISVLAASSEEILAVTTQVAASTQETATAISEIATTVEEVKQTAILAGGKSQAVV